MNKVYLVAIVLVLQGCIFRSYNMRQNFKYSALAQAYTDSFECAQHCHKDSLAQVYIHISMRYGDSANLYYAKANPDWDKAFKEQPLKCDCK